MPFFHKWFLKNQEGLEQLLRGLWKLTRKSYSICNCAGPCSASTSLKGFALHLQRFKHLMGQNRKLSLNFSHMHSTAKANIYWHHGTTPWSSSLSWEPCYATKDSDNRAKCWVLQWAVLAFNTVGFQQTGNAVLRWISMQGGRILR